MVTKEQILEEIKRTTEANGGQPLGSKKFEHETGIKKSDWLGKYWARWSDAVREVGFTPNRLTSAYQDTHIFEKYVQLARELGRLPASSDLRLKARNTSTFPSKGPFEKYGVKSEFIKRLLEYCQNREGYEDVVCMCLEYVPRTKGTSEESEHPTGEFGFVYLLKSGQFYKIGKSNAIGRREYEIAIQLPEKVKRIHVIRTDDPSGIEVYWHKRFEARRRNGEWFELNATDIAAFKRRKFM